MSTATPLLQGDHTHAPPQRGTQAHGRGWSAHAPGSGAAHPDRLDLGDRPASGQRTPRWADKPGAPGGKGRLRMSGKNVVLLLLLGVLLFAGFESVRYNAWRTGRAGAGVEVVTLAEPVVALEQVSPKVTTPTSKPTPKPKPKVKPSPAAVAKPAGPSSALDRTKLAFMIEPRHEPILVPVLLDFIRKVPEEWPHLLFTSQATIDDLKATPKIDEHVRSGKLALRVIPSKWNVHDGHSLSDFMADSWLWEQLAPAEYLLTYQTDSILCSNSEYSVNDFLGTNMTDTKLEGGYAYVGAVWSRFRWPSPPNGGNGGLSLRRRSIMLEMTQKETRVTNHNEDVWFVEQIKKYYDSDRAFADQEVAMRFSFESLPLGASHLDWALRPLGVHVGSSCKRRVEHARQRRILRQLLEYCPEARMVIHNACMPTDEDLGEGRPGPASAAGSRRKKAGVREDRFS